MQKLQSNIHGRARSVRVDAAASPSAPKKLAILGASGYTGADCIRLALQHPNIEIAALTAERQAGKPFSSVYPHIGYVAPTLPELVKIGDVDFSAIDVAFCCLPHATTQNVLAGLPQNVRVVDLSADFRLRNVDTYAEWYGDKHQAVDMQKEAVYGLTEMYRKDVQSARLVANPGCYPTCSLLPLLPILKAGLIKPENITIDAKSGVSGAGRAPKEANLYCEVAEGLHAYGVGKHRHMPEIEQELSLAARGQVTISFTPHLIPMSRGMQISAYVNLEGSATVEDLRTKLEETYANEQFVKLLPKGVVPQTRHVRGSNYAFMNVFEDRIAGRAIVQCVIDNVMKGASGQAMQNLNLMIGSEENCTLSMAAVYP